MSRSRVGVVLLTALFLPSPLGFAQIQNVPPFRFGINFPFRSPETASLATFLRLLNDAGTPALRQLTFADVHWIQIEPQNDVWNFVRADSAIENSNGIQCVPTFYHMAASPTRQVPGLQVPWRACYDASANCGWNAARDSSDSKDYVQTVVRRYQSRVKYWEIANEMSSKMRRPLGLPLAEFVEFMHMNYRWIKEIDPQASVLNPGLLGTYGLPMDRPRGWLREFLAAGGVGSFDILSYHDYNSWWTLPAHFDSLKALLDEFGLGSMPIWCTESSISSDPGVRITPDYASVDEQAADVWRRPVVLFARGLQAYFWHSGWSSGGQSEWREFGILSANGKKKKSFHAYRLLVDKLEGFAEARALSFGEVTEDNNRGGDGVWVVEFRWPDGTRRWVAWSPDNQTFDLTQLHSAQLNVTVVVPTSLSSDGETANFDSYTVDVTNDTARLALTGTPILIEESNVTAVESNTKSAPDGFALFQNYPNPFNPSTSVRFFLPRKANVVLKVFDLSGKEVAILVDEERPAGQHTVRFDAMGLASGVYLLRLTAGQWTQMRKAILMK
ncbi:MAG: T9SS type A sorting domain-containing protein [candidate division KSB1 bacterium]|nr:T9SS type A sorting domain-containing protein [candidate division KSB1 bacterium]